MRSGLTNFLLPYVICAVVLGPLAGWLAARQSTPFRFFARHPWRVMWIGATLLTVSILVFVDFFGDFGRDVRPITMLPVYLSLLVSGLGSVQGLRLAWSRSWRKGALILLGFLLATYVETISVPRDTADFNSHFYAAISLAPSWALAAWIAHRVGRRCVSVAGP